MADQESSHPVLLGNPLARPTDDKLKGDAASLTDQYIHYWNKGEVECVVILSRPGAKVAAYASSEMKRERLLFLLELVKAESQIQSVLVHNHKKVR